MPRAGEGPDVIPDGVVGLPFDGEAFLAALDVVGQRAVSETEAADRLRLVDEAHDATGIQPPQAEDVRDHRHPIAGLDRGVLRPDFRPRGGEHLPTAQSGTRSLEDRPTDPEQNPVVVKVVAGGWLSGRLPHLVVGEAVASLDREEVLDSVIGRFLEAPHDFPDFTVRKPIPALYQEPQEDEKSNHSRSNSAGLRTKKSSTKTEGTDSREGACGC